MANQELFAKNPLFKEDGNKQQNDNRDPQGLHKLEQHIE